MEIASGSTDTTTMAAQVEGNERGGGEQTRGQRAVEGLYVPVDEFQSSHLAVGHALVFRHCRPDDYASFPVGSKVFMYASKLKMNSPLS